MERLLRCTLVRPHPGWHVPSRSPRTQRREQPPPAAASADVSLAGRARSLAVPVLARLGSAMGADSPGMVWDPAWGEGPSGGPALGAILGMTFGEVLSSSKLDWRQAVFPQRSGRTQRETWLCRELQGDPVPAPSPAVRLSPSLRSSRAARAMLVCWQAHYSRSAFN